MHTYLSKMLYASICSKGMGRLTVRDIHKTSTNMFSIDFDSVHRSRHLSLFIYLDVHHLSGGLVPKAT